MIDTGSGEMRSKNAPAREAGAWSQPGSRWTPARRRRVAAGLSGVTGGLRLLA